MHNNTLFILFYFPPFPRVGGRRWAKHIKYLQRFGEKFYVLAGDYKESSPWDEDILCYKDKISRIPVSIYYPYFKRSLPKNLFQKVRWLCSLNYNKRIEKKYKGNFWDDSRTYEKLFLEKAKQIVIERKINHICLSAGPYSYASILPKLKKQFPYLKITVDFRDYWEDCLISLSESKKREEEDKILDVMESVDLVLAPNSEMCKFYTEKYNKNAYCLPHCIDEDYLKIQKSIKKQNAKEFVIVYGGALYSGLDKYINQFISIIKGIEEFGYFVNLKIYTMQPNYMDVFKKSNINYTVEKHLPTKEFINIVNKSDLLVLFRPDWSPNGFSTKFFEYVALRKPVLYLGPKGDVNKFIFDNNLGYSFNEEDINGLIKKMVENIKTQEVPDQEFDLSQYMFDFQTKKIINYWNSYYGFVS